MNTTPPGHASSAPVQVSGAFATGGGGTVFELKVQASILVTLVVHGYAPIFKNSRVTELHLQAEHFGFSTDDALVVCRSESGQKHKQLWSIKHEVRFSKLDSVFRDVVADAWKDFNAPLFSPDTDVFVLATSNLAAVGKHVVTLLEIADTALSSEDFRHRIATRGFASQKVNDYLEIFEAVLTDVAGHTIDEVTLWRFLRTFNVLRFDFDQNASQDEARMKTLLYLATRANADKTGEEIWNGIFQKVAESNSRAGSFNGDSLPPEWARLFVAIEKQFESGTIHRLLDHSVTLLTRIKKSLGPNLQFPRTELIEQISASLIDQQFTIVTGPAGVGKSVAAVTTIESVRRNAPLFVFQATEFAHDHLDEALQNLRITDSLTSISALFGLLPAKFILIESVERLLESTARDSFLMLLSQLKADTTWRVIMTCRQHSVLLVQEAFLRPLSIPAIEIMVPPLADIELKYVAQQIPQLERLIANTKTRNLLRNPWYLDKACSINWKDEERPDSLSEKQLRELLWRHVVIREEVRTNGIHLKRKRCFEDVVVSRARSLQTFVAFAPGDEGVVEALVADGLLVQESYTYKVAPSHDVLEDWALIRWVNNEFLDYANRSQEPRMFFDRLGSELPIRRSYRNWLNETLAEDDREVIYNFVDSVLRSSELARYWKDETVVSVLLSDEGAGFIRKHKAFLCDDKKAYFNRVAHLLRVACKTPNLMWAGSGVVNEQVLGDLYLVPTGNAWVAVFELILRRIQEFEVNELPLVIGLLEDWKTLVNWRNPAPVGAREVGLIALDFWSRPTTPKVYLEQLATVILSVTAAIPDEFRSLLHATVDIDDWRDSRSTILTTKLLSSIECGFACLSHPKDLADFAEKTWGIEPPSLVEPDWDRRSAIDMDRHFGLPSRHDLNYSPASALQGPFYYLLRAHPLEGVNLITKLVSVSTRRYVELGLDSQKQGAVWEVGLVLSDGRTHKQWSSERLWCLYREGSPGPALVESALMALEKWLLELAEAGLDLEVLVNRLIEASNSVAITAVLVSVSLAYPDKLGSSILTLVGLREFYNLDRLRTVHDLSSMGQSFRRLYADARDFDQERTASDKLPHRQFDLESLVLTLQGRKLREEVWKIIDRFKSELPSSESQTMGDKLWRLRLHRMDIRNYSTVIELSDGRIELSPAQPDADLVPIVEEGASYSRTQNEVLAILNWGLSVFRYENLDKYDRLSWRAMLRKAQSQGSAISSDQSQSLDLNQGGVAYVAAVCVRDHWTELSLEEQTWCTSLLLSVLEESQDLFDEHERHQRFSFSGSRAAAYVLPLLLDYGEPIISSICAGIAAAITHAVDEVRSYAADGIGQFLWRRNPDLASSCIAGLFAIATLENDIYEQWQLLPWDSRPPLEELIAEKVRALRTDIASNKVPSETANYSFDLTDGYLVRILPLIMKIVSEQQDMSLAQTLMHQVSQAFVNLWEQEEQANRHPSTRYEITRDFEGEADLQRELAHFLVRCSSSNALQIWAPLSASVADYSNQVAEFFQNLVFEQDAIPESDGFWAIWRDTRDRLINDGQAINKLVNKNSTYSKLGTSLLLEHMLWNEGARDWKPLHGHNADFQALIESVGIAPPICKSFIRLLASVGHTSMFPQGLEWLHKQLKLGDPTAMIGDRNSLYLLSKLLTPLVYGQTKLIRNSPHLRNCILDILDEMVDLGSSTAFRMRDFLISPLSPALLIVPTEHFS